MSERYFLDRDNDGHWYIVPESRAEEWDTWAALSDDDMRSWDVPRWAIEIGGGTRLVRFTDPIDTQGNPWYDTE